MRELTKSVVELSLEMGRYPELAHYESLMRLLAGLAAQFDDGELPANAVQQLRQGLKEARDGLEAVRAEDTSEVEVMLAEARASERP